VCKSAERSPKKEGGKGERRKKKGNIFICFVYVGHEYMDDGDKEKGKKKKTRRANEGVN